MIGLKWTVTKALAYAPFRGLRYQIENGIAGCKQCQYSKVQTEQHDSKKDAVQAFCVDVLEAKVGLRLFENISLAAQLEPNEPHGEQ